MYLCDGADSNSKHLSSVSVYNFYFYVSLTNNLTVCFVVCCLQDDSQNGRVRVKKTAIRTGYTIGGISHHIKKHRSPLEEQKYKCKRAGCSATYTTPPGLRAHILHGRLRIRIECNIDRCDATGWEHHCKLEHSGIDVVTTSSREGKSQRFAIRRDQEAQCG